MIGKMSSRKARYFWCKCGKKKIKFEKKGLDKNGNVWVCENCGKHYFGMNVKEIKQVFNN